MDDFDLLQEYVKRQAEDAFATVVQRHLNLVYSAAMRQMCEPYAAEEVTQAVFLILARKAASIRPGTILAAWLLRATRYTAANLRRQERRRHDREREAMNLLYPTETESVWAQITPFLDFALDHLREKDRNVIALRFFQQKSFKEIGAALGLSENNARMLLNRAVERLRKILTRKGVSVAGGTLASTMAVGVVQSAPSQLLEKVTAAAAAKGTGAAGSVAALVKLTLSYLAWMRIKTGIVIGVSSVLLTGLMLYLAPLIAAKFEPENLVRNGDFEQGLTNWQAIFWSQSQATVAAEPAPGTEGLAAKFSITRIGLVDTFEFVQAPLPLKVGHKYAVTFRARSTTNQPIRVLVTKDKKPWTFYGCRVSAEIGPRWRTYHLSARAMLTAEDGRIVFHCRGAIGDIWIDDVKFQDRGT